MVNLTIDGKPVEVQEGTTVLQAAKEAAIHIPTLCDHPALKPFGGCRLCLVEVEGMRTLQPSCTLPVSDKMNIRTVSDKIKAARRFVLTLIFSDRNHFCPYCQVSGGDCDLQNAAINEDMSHWPFQPNWQSYKVDASHQHMVMDHNRCILCQRCVRACGQLVGNFTLGIENRGASSMLIADVGVPFGDSSCVACGTCAAVCPTGAIIERRAAYQGPTKEMTATQSVCAGCSVGCGINVYSRDNRLVRITGDWEAPVNGGVLCKVGRFLPLEEDRQRITTPMVKKNGQLQPAGWDEALETLAARLKPMRGANGSGVAAVASTRLPVEALSLFKQIFADGMGSSMVTSLEEGQMTSAAYALAKELGMPFEANLAALEDADCVLTAGVDLAEDHAVAGFLVKRNLPSGTRLVIIDSGNNGLSASADANLKPVSGTTTDVLKGVKAALTKLGLAEGDGTAATAELTLAAQLTGISENDFLTAAGVIGTASKPVFVFGKDTAASPVQSLRQLLDLAQLAGAQVITVKGEANSLAAAQNNLEQPFVLNGHQAAYVALGDDTPSQRLMQKLEKAPFLAVQASYASRLTAMADVVLPVGIWSEEEGHFINMEGRLQKTNQSLVAPEGVYSNENVLKTVGEQLGLQLNENWQDLVCARTAPVRIAV
jgi:formate dehydrogenase major subunit